jgi:dienelactone hydrolase
MRCAGLVLLAGCLGGLFAAPEANPYAPPKPQPPDKETAATIRERTDRLAETIDRLQRQGLRDPVLVDIEVYLKAARSIVKHGEFYGADSGKWTLAVLDRGLLRASQAGRGESPWLSTGGQSVVRAYRSRIDGSVQPYAVTYPHDYARDRRKRYRIDIVLHERQPALTEVAFLQQHRGDKPAPKDLSHVQIEVYGRGNNAYRWAGETDVSEAFENFLTVEAMLGRTNFLDAARVVLRGFSMGGAGSWHIGLHQPDRFCVIGPGAGFTTTRGYVPKLPAQLPDYQEACLHIYDAVDYAENAFNVPVVAYSGADDKQIQAARNIEAKLKPLGIPMTHLVAPKLGHTFPPPWRKKAEALYARHAEQGRPEYPSKVRFVTWTLKYPSCFWVDVMGLEKHYHKASVQAERTEDGFLVKTANVRVLHLNLWPGAIREAIVVAIDGQKLDKVTPYQARGGDLHVYLEKRAGKWSVVLPERLFTQRLRVLQKVPGLQGPIDDAFTGPFLCVRGTGTAWHEDTEEHAKVNLERFRAEWSKYLRGEVHVKDDTEVTAADIASHHLILFGDPASNRLIEQVLPGLPLKWTRKALSLGGKSYDSAAHVPVMIYPSPLAADRYVVLNSGHTFRARDFERTNALLYPRLGDYAVLKLTGGKKSPLATEVQIAGLFDDYWRLAGGP